MQIYITEILDMVILFNTSLVVVVKLLLHPSFFGARVWNNSDNDLKNIPKAKSFRKHFKKQKIFSFNVTHQKLITYP